MNMLGDAEVSTLTIEFSGVLDEILSELVKRGYAKTKSEAVRSSLLHYGEELGMVHLRLHAIADEAATDEVMRKMKKLRLSE